MKIIPGEAISFTFATDNFKSPGNCLCKETDFAISMKTTNKYGQISASSLFTEIRVETFENLLMQKLMG